MKTVRALLMVPFLLLLAGCFGTFGGTVPDKLPKPIINPALLKSCPEDLSQLDLANGFSFNAVLQARRDDSVQYRNCVCRVEKLRLTVCALAEITCAPQLPLCDKINTEQFPADSANNKEKPK